MRPAAAVRVACLLLCSMAFAPARAYQTGRALNPVESLAVINVFSMVPGISTPDPYVIHIQVTDLRCQSPPRSCTYAVQGRPGIPLIGEAAQTLARILGSKAEFVPKVSCSLSLLTQVARCWLIDHD